MIDFNEFEKRIGALEKMVRQHHRIITLNIVTVIVLSISLIFTSLRTAKILEVIDQIIQMIQETVVAFPVV